MPGELHRLKKFVFFFLKNRICFIKSIFFQDSNFFPQAQATNGTSVR